LNRKLAVTFVSVLLLTTVLGTQLIGREANNIADSKDSEHYNVRTLDEVRLNMNESFIETLDVNLSIITGVFGGFGKNSQGSTGEASAQSFFPTVGVITRVAVYITVFESPDNETFSDMYVRIETDVPCGGTYGNPSGVALGKAKIPASQFADHVATNGYGKGAWFEAAFAEPLQVTPGNRYHLTIFNHDPDVYGFDPWEGYSTYYTMVASGPEDRDGIAERYEDFYGGWQCGKYSSWDIAVKIWGVRRDIAVTEVITSTTKVYAGQIVNVTVTAKNFGNMSETFNVTAYYDNTSIGTHEVISLAWGTETTLTFVWNTTHVAGGLYTVSAYATIFSGEFDKVNNVYVNGLVRVTSPVRIAEVIPCNQTGYFKDAFELGTMAYFKVAINSTALVPQDTLITINLYDNSSITTGIASFQGPILPGTSTIIFGVPIPTTVTTGTATVYANAYTDWPHLGGFPHCPEKSATLEITGP